MSEAPAARMTGSDVGPSLGAFVAEHYPRLVRLAALISRDRADAEDAVQAALERAWRSRIALQDPERLRSWLDRIVVRETLRLVGRRRAAVELRVLDDHVVSAPVAEDLAVRIALTRLSPEQRAAVVLHLYAGHTVPETARLLNVREETVRSRLRVARDHLRRLLGEEASR